MPEEEDIENNEGTNWKYRASMIAFWIILLVLVSSFFIDFFPFSMPIWGEWRFLIGK